MKNKVFFLCIPLLLHGELLLAQNTASSSASPSSPTAWIDAKMEKIIIPKLEFKDTPVPQVLDILLARAIEFDPDHSGVSLSVKLDPTTVQPGQLSNPETLPRNARITLSLSDIPYHQALTYIANLAGFRIQKSPYSVALVPESDPKPLVIKEYTLDPKWLEDVAKEGNDDSGNLFKDKFKRFPKEALKQYGVEFPTGSSAVLNPKNLRLTVRNTEESFEIVDLFVDSLKPLPPPPTQPEPPKILPEKDAEDKSRMREKLQRIVLPNVSLNNVTLREAVDYLKKLSSQFDLQERDIDRKGANIIITATAPDAFTTSSEAPPTPAEEDLPEKRISLQRHNINLLETLEALAKLSNRKLRIVPYAVTIVPLSDPGPWITKEYVVLPNFLNGTTTPSQTSSNKFLEASGVAFPPSGGASYNPRSHRLVVTGSEEKHQQVEKLIEESWEQYLSQKGADSNPKKAN